MKNIEVVAAIIQYEGKYLCVQRDKSKYDYISYKYEFPGGKVEDTESLEDALKREIKEELCLQIVNLQKFLTVEHHYPDFFLKMHSFICSASGNIPKLSVHIDYQWLPITELHNLDWAEADKPIVHKLEEQYESSN